MQHQQLPKVATTDFYHKGWRGEGEQEVMEERDMLMEALQSAAIGGRQNLRETLRRLLESGGDERSMTIPSTGLTKYNVPTCPCVGIHRGSCTSNAPSEAGFARGIDVLRQLLIESKNSSRQHGKDILYSSPEDLFRKLLCDIRERLRGVFSLSFEDIISLFPSGTDAELLPALLALMRAIEREDRGSEVCSVVTAAGEVGSGTLLASMGKDFAKCLPSGNFALAGGVFETSNMPQAGYFTGKSLYVRDETGKLLSSETRDAQVEEAVRSAVEEVGTGGLPRFGCILVHMVVGSKTGHCMPSVQCLERLVARFGNLVLPVVDACQGRLGEEDIRRYLDRDWAVLSTGSKFFAGPPFSGVCLMSHNIGQEVELLLSNARVLQVVGNSRLKEYVVASLVSDDLPSLRALLPQKPLNYGLLMRWTLALYEMEIFYTEMASSDRVQIMRQWSQQMRSIVREIGGPNVKLLEEEEATLEADGEQAAALSTIISFSCYCHRSPEAQADSMSMDELRQVQLLMASDLSQARGWLENLPAPLQQVAQTKCFMGQPVDLSPQRRDDPPTPCSRHVLRVALSAPLVARAGREGLDAVLADDRKLFDKLKFVLGNWSLLQNHKVPA
jgi:hypothetical protein